MTPYLFIIGTLLVFGIFGPMTFGRKWHSEYKKGYRFGVINAATAVVAVAAVLHLQLKIF